MLMVWPTIASESGQARNTATLAISGGQNTTLHAVLGGNCSDHFARSDFLFFLGFDSPGCYRVHLDVVQSR
jgi:hypothetical protein